MDNELFITELRGMRDILDVVVTKLDTLIFNFNMLHQAQVNQGVELNALKGQCAQRGLRCPVLSGSYPPPPAPTPTPTPAPGSNGGVP